MDTPHEKPFGPILAIGGLTLLTIGISFLPASWFGINPVVRKYEPLNLTSLGTIEQVAQDNDNDGTISWKEFIAGSLDISPAQVNDSEITKSIASDPRAIASLNDPNNLTSSFSKNLYVASTLLQKNGITDPTREQETMNQLLAGEAAKIQQSSFTDNDVKKGTSDTSAALKVYGNAVATILGGIISEESIEGDLTALAAFTESKDEADLAPVFKSKARVSSAMEKLLTLQVPPSAVSVHVKALNNIGAFSGTLSDFSRAYDDPLRATLAINHYPDDAVQALRTFPEFAAFFKEKRVTFSAKEAGYVFVVGYTGK